MNLAQQINECCFAGAQIRWLRTRWTLRSWPRWASGLPRSKCPSTPRALSERASRPSRPPRASQFRSSPTSVSPLSDTARKSWAASQRCAHKCPRPHRDSSSDLPQRPNPQPNYSITRGLFGRLSKPQITPHYLICAQANRPPLINAASPSRFHLQLTIIAFYSGSLFFVPSASHYCSIFFLLRFIYFNAHLSLKNCPSFFSSCSDWVDPFCDSCWTPW